MDSILVRQDTVDKFYTEEPEQDPLDQASAVLGLASTVFGAAATFTGPVGMAAAATFGLGVSVFDGVLGMTKEPEPTTRDSYRCLKEGIEELETTMNTKIAAVRNELSKAVNQLNDRINGQQLTVNGHTRILRGLASYGTLNTLLVFQTQASGLKIRMQSLRRANEALYQHRTTGLRHYNPTVCAQKGTQCEMISCLQGPSMEDCQFPALQSLAGYSFTSNDLQTMHLRAIEGDSTRLQVKSLLDMWAASAASWKEDLDTMASGFAAADTQTGDIDLSSLPTNLKTQLLKSGLLLFSTYWWVHAQQAELVNEYTDALSATLKAYSAHKGAVSWGDTVDFSELMKGEAEVKLPSNYWSTGAPMAEAAQDFNLAAENFTDAVLAFQGTTWPSCPIGSSEPFWSTTSFDVTANSIEAPFCISEAAPRVLVFRYFGPTMQRRTLVATPPPGWETAVCQPTDDSLENEINWVTTVSGRNIAESKVLSKWTANCRDTFPPQYTSQYDAPPLGRLRALGHRQWGLRASEGCKACAALSNSPNMLTWPYVDLATTFRDSVVARLMGQTSMATLRLVAKRAWMTKVVGPTWTVTVPANNDELEKEYALKQILSLRPAPPTAVVHTSGKCAASTILSRSQCIEVATAMGLEFRGGPDGQPYQSDTRGCFQYFGGSSNSNNGKVFWKAGTTAGDPDCSNGYKCICAVSPLSLSPSLSPSVYEWDAASDTKPPGWTTTGDLTVQNNVAAWDLRNAYFETTPETEVGDAYTHVYWVWWDGQKSWRTGFRTKPDDHCLLANGDGTLGVYDNNGDSPGPRGFNGATSAAIAAGTWQFVVTVGSGFVTRFYTATSASTSPTSAGTAQANCAGGNKYWRLSYPRQGIGYLAQAWAFDWALTEAQVAKLFEDTAGRYKVSPVARGRL